MNTLEKSIKLYESMQSMVDCAKITNEAGESGLEKFCKKHGIEVDKSCQYGLGFSEKEQKYYGWSHRAIYGFGIGYECKKGHCGYEEMIKQGHKLKCDTLEDCKQAAIDFAKSIS